MINNYEDAFHWYQENAHRIDGFEFVEDDGSRRPLTNTEMYWLTQIRQAEDDGVDVPTDPQAQLEQALLRICELTRKSGELEADNARLRDSLKVERDAVKRLNVKVAEASTLTSRLAASEAEVENLRLKCTAFDYSLTQFEYSAAARMQERDECRRLLREACDHMPDTADGWAENWINRAEAALGVKP